MQMMRQSWTDERLDDFRAEVNRRFDKVEGEIRDLRLEVRAGFQKIDERFERMYRLILTLGGAFIAAAISSHLLF